MTKLLIVDDDRMNCELLQDLFSRQGYAVIVAMSGREDSIYSERPIRS